MGSRLGTRCLANSKDFARLVAPAAASTTAATVAAAANAATIAAAPATAAATAFGLGPRFVDGKRASLHLFAVESGNGGLGLLIAPHLHEAEPLRSARVAVHDDLRGLHSAVGLEDLLQFAVAHAVG